MKFSIKKDILLESLNIVSHAISNKNIIPVLGGIKFDLKKEGLYLESSDNEIDIKTFIDKKMIDKIDKEGTIVVQGKYLLDIVRKLPDTVINIEVIDGLKILIHTENSKFNLNGISGDFDHENDLTGLTRFKLGFNAHIEEYIGEFTLTVDKSKKQIHDKLSPILDWLNTPIL